MNLVQSISLPMFAYLINFYQLILLTVFCKSLIKGLLIKLHWASIAPLAILILVLKNVFLMHLVKLLLDSCCYALSLHRTLAHERSWNLRFWLFHALIFNFLFRFIFFPQLLLILHLIIIRINRFIYPNLSNFEH
jgi:hypothetical protein